MGPERQERSEFFRNWYEQRVRDKLDRLGNVAARGGDLQSALDDALTNHGNIERKLADSHEGRELIELVQNARDAIREGDPERRQVYLGVFDQGVLVANTGVPFDLREDDTERAVKMVGESNKTDDDEAIDVDADIVGHIGVGLKSTLSVGDAFEVWTRLDDAKNPLRVRYSRAYITAAVAARFGHDVANTDLGDALVGRFDRAVRDEGLFEPDRAARREGPYDIPPDLGKAPLFWFPWPLEPTEDPDTGNAAASDPRLVERANALLTDPAASLTQHEDPPDVPFRTAVFVEYEDDCWRDLLEALGIDPATDSPDDLVDHADELWEEVAHGGTTTGFNPETLAQLGSIDDLYLERVRSDSASGTADRSTVTAEHWSVSRDRNAVDFPNAGVEHEAVRIAIDAEAAVPDRQFDQFDANWEGTDDTNPRILVDHDNSPASQAATVDDGRWNLSANEMGTSAGSGDRPHYPLYLYYPISNTDGALPICLHGRFKVTTERKDLSKNAAEHNRQVLTHAAELIGRVAAGAATLADAETPRNWDRYPWDLLPPAPSEDTPPASPTKTNQLLEWFRHKCYAALREQPCVPTTGGRRLPDEVALYADHSSVAGIAAAATIAHRAGSGSFEEFRTDSTTGNRTTASDARRYVPAPPTARYAMAALRRYADGERRLGTLISDPEAERVLRDWTKWLSSSLTPQAVDDAADGDPGSYVLTAEALPALDYFHGVAQLVTDAATDRDCTERELIDEVLGDTLDEVYLLPCLRTDDDLDLVTIEPSPTGDIATGERMRRTVMWDLDPEDLDVEFPPEHGDFSVHFLSPDAGRGDARDVLSAAGKEQAWGVHQYDTPADLYEALLETFTTEGATIDGGSLAALTDFLSSIRSEGSKFDQSEFAFADREFLRGVTSSSQRRRDVRLRLGIRRARLCLDDTESPRLSDVALPDRWQRIRAVALSESDSVGDDAPTEDPIEEWDQCPALAGRTLPEYDAAPDFWLTVPIDVERKSVRGRLARVVSLLGLSTLPGIRILPQYGQYHPDFRSSPSPNWDPREWERDPDLTSYGRTLWSSLQDAFERWDYDRWVTAASNHPRRTAYHAASCDGRPSDPEEFGNEESYLVSWVWFDPQIVEYLTDHPATILELFRRHGERYVDSILGTHWHCRQYSSSCGRTDAVVPTLANLQLRSLPVWDEIVTVGESVRGEWAMAGERLDCAVFQTSTGGRDGWRLFPHVDPDETDIPRTALESLGVAEIDELDVTGAEYRLQRLLESLAEAPDGAELSELDRPVSLEVPKDRREDWKRAYTQLLRPIMSYCAERGDEDPDAVLSEGLSFLTHLPLKQDREWVVASLDWIRQHGGERVWRFPDDSPPRWVEQAVHGSDEDQYLLEHPIVQSGFADFADLLSVERVTADEPRLDRETFDDRRIEIETTLGPDRTSEWVEELRDRLPLLLAVQETRSEDRLKDMTDRLKLAIENLAVVDRIPDGVREHLSDPRSVTYELDEGAVPSDHEGDKALGIALDGSEIDSPSLSDLAMGVALLTDQYRNVGNFSRVLEEDLSYQQLRDRLEKGPFPVTDVETFLRDRRQKDFRARLDAGTALIDRLGNDPPPVEPVLRELDDLDDEDPGEVLDSLGSDVEGEHSLKKLPPAISDYVEVCRTTPPWARSLLALLLGESDRSADDVREYVSSTVPRGDRPTVIEWLVDHEGSLPVRLLPHARRQYCQRLRTVWEVWLHAETPFLESEEDWRDRIEDHSPVRVEWNDRLPTALAEPDDLEFWFDFSTREEIATATAGFERHLVEEDVPETTAGAVVGYVLDNELPAEDRNQAGSDHKRRALSQAAREIQADGLGAFDILESVSDDGGLSGDLHDSGENGSPEGGGGGGMGSFTGRGELAEVAVTLEILQNLADWLEEDFEQRYRRLTDRFEALYEEQQLDANDYQWHTERQWENTVLPLVEKPAGQVRDQFLSWDGLLQKGVPMDDLVPYELIDISNESGPGYDVIDPFGPPPDRSDGNLTLDPVPVEIKAVDETASDHTIKWTTNQYQQCRHHAMGSDHPYCIRLVHVPTDGPKRVADARPVGTRVVDERSDLEDLLNLPVDMRVKSGYLWVEFTQSLGW